MFHNSDERVPTALRRCVLRAGGHWQNRNREGPGQKHGQAVQGVQLRAGHRLQDDGRLLQGHHLLRRLGLLRRVQPHHARGPQRHRAVPPVFLPPKNVARRTRQGHEHQEEGQGQLLDAEGRPVVHVHGQGDCHQTYLQCLHYYESRLTRQAAVA